MCDQPQSFYREPLTPSVRTLFASGQFPLLAGGWKQHLFGTKHDREESPTPRWAQTSAAKNVQKHAISLARICVVFFLFCNVLLRSQEDYSNLQHRETTQRELLRRRQWLHIWGQFRFLSSTEAPPLTLMSGPLQLRLIPRSSVISVISDRSSSSNSSRLMSWVNLFEKRGLGMRRGRGVKKEKSH